jgi:hypothetical protein
MDAEDFCAKGFAVILVTAGFIGLVALTCLIFLGDSTTHYYVKACGDSGNSSLMQENRWRPDTLVVGCLPIADVLRYRAALEPVEKSAESYSDCLRRNIKAEAQQ